MPRTPRTFARPPSLPSVPTSRATRVTSSPKVESWSTSVLTVSFRLSISPWTSMVIFLLRSPWAIAVVTAEMSRTWLVRLSAIELTFSVTSRQAPETPSTLALPPSLPSVPTSRATRVTSSVNPLIWSAIRFTVVASRSRSPLSSPRRPSVEARRFSWPSATESRTWATSVTGSATSSRRSFRARALLPHAPRAGLTLTRSLSRPSSRTMSPTRCRPLLSCSLWSITSLKTEAISLMVPLPRLRRRTLKSPSRMRYRARRISSSCSSATSWTASGIESLH